MLRLGAPDVEVWHCWKEPEPFFFFLMQMNASKILIGPGLLANVADSNCDSLLMEELGLGPPGFVLHSCIHPPFGVLFRYATQTNRSNSSIRCYVEWSLLQLLTFVSTSQPAQPSRAGQPLVRGPGI